MADEFGNVRVLFFLLNFLASDLEHWSDPAAAEHPSSKIKQDLNKLNNFVLSKNE